jgi:hypothetical protein
MTRRNESDRAVDAVWLLHFLRGASPILGRTKVQKVAFLVQLRLRDLGLKGPHFKFFRFTNGPFSRHLWDTFDELAEAGFVKRQTFELTQRGQFLHELALAVLKDVPDSLRALEASERVLRGCRKYTGQQLMERVYDLKVAPDEAPDRPVKIRDMPTFLDILCPPPGSGLPTEAVQLIQDELRLTDAELEAARRRAPAVEREAVTRLATALSASGRS